MSNRKIPNENVTEKDLRKIVRKTNRTEEQKEIKKFIIILLGVILVVVAFYFFTKDVVKKDSEQKKEKTEVTFNYNRIIMGELFNRPYDEYYALIYNTEDLQANYYYSLFSNYSAKENSLKIYTVDLNDEMNKKFYNKNNSNPNAKSLEDLQVSNLTLIKIKDKKINKYIEKEEDIRSELGL